MSCGRRLASDFFFVKCYFAFGSRPTWARFLCSKSTITITSPSILPTFSRTALAQAEVAEARKLAEAGDPEFQDRLGGWYYHGKHGLPLDPQQAFVLFRKAAMQGYAPAQNNLGSSYFEGVAVEEDCSEGLRWYLRAAEQGYGPAQCNVGACYKEGRGVEPNFKEAMLWFRKAADSGDTGGLNNLAGCLLLMGEDGLAVPHTAKALRYDKALLYLRQAARMGCVEAQGNLGELLAQGAEGVTPDHAEAARWLRKAAIAGFPGALCSLGVLHMMGEGLKKNSAFACKCWLKAAKEGDVRAMSRLSHAFQQGDGVERDSKQSEQWLHKAFQKAAGGEGSSSSSDRPPNFQEEVVMQNVVVVKPTPHSFVFVPLGPPLFDLPGRCRDWDT